MKSVRLGLALTTLVFLAVACGPFPFDRKKTGESTPSKPQTQTPASKPTVNACVAAVEARAKTDKNITTDAGRRQMEMDLATCRFPNDKGKAILVGSVNADLARAAKMYFAGTMNGPTYDDISRDRQRKFTTMINARPVLEKLILGDKDRDLVPDDRDACPDTAEGVPTDDKGCPIPLTCAPDSECGRQAKVNEEEIRRKLAETKILYDPQCNDAPAPETPEMLRWGYGTSGNEQWYNFEVSRVKNQPAECGVFYEIEIHFMGVDSKGVLTKTGMTSMVFNAPEARKVSADRFLFGVTANSPTPGRKKAAHQFHNSKIPLWRVRAVNGMHRMSPWSSYHLGKQASGPFDG